MAMPEDKKPVYDERVKEILRGLAQGKTRDELAVAFGHKNYKSLDMHMRRRNFTWDRHRQTYVPEFCRFETEGFNDGPPPSTKVANVLSFFEKEDADPRVIAKQLGFSDHRELASYMKGKGYEWSTEKKNYVRKVGIVEKTEAAAVEEKDVGVADGGAAASKRQADSVCYVQEPGSSDLSRFLPLLEMLEKNKDRLFGLILPGADGGKVPRYVVPGVLMTKSVHMPNTLDNLVKEYAREKNISQRDIFQVALIDFFRRYGYEREIDTLLGER
jgi:hypothetical protein